MSRPVFSLDLRQPLAHPHGVEADVDKAAYRAALESHGHDAMAFEGLKSGMRHWRDPASDNVLAYAEVAGAWVAVGAPRDIAVVERFELAARAARKRALFFGAEHRLPGWSALPIGEQPVFGPRGWERALATSRRLREQLRRARKKRVVVRVVAGPALLELRPQVEALARGWLESHHLDPLG
ncbi:MAG TPA: phosphatidylglycerol lysyltransferase domain-containing protein, partial [Myxococcota bacterium]|nr:phosphatidylglycerol lysyltransferase domain-containing protein [Myxococcota bacterium]